MGWRRSLWDFKTLTAPQISLSLITSSPFHFSMRPADCSGDVGFAEKKMKWWADFFLFRNSRSWRWLEGLRKLNRCQKLSGRQERRQRSWGQNISTLQSPRESHRQEWTEESQHYSHQPLDLGNWVNKARHLDALYSSKFKKSTNRHFLSVIFPCYLRHGHEPLGQELMDSPGFLSRYSLSLHPCHSFLPWILLWLCWE